MAEVHEKPPVVSVIMPAYNAEKFIAKAIDSVIAQTVSDWELLIIDDRSSDETLRIAEEYAKSDTRIKLLQNEKNSGAAITRNNGIAAASGKYIALLDSDDVWHSDKLEKQLNKLAATDAAICYTSFSMVDESGSKVRADYLIPESTDFEAMLSENVIGCSTVMLKADAAKENPFDPSFYHEDYLMWLKLLGSGYTAVGCPEVLTDWCYRENSRSYNKFESMKKRWAIYREALSLPFGKSVYHICRYAAAGIKKYSKMP